MIVKIIQHQASPGLQQVLSGMKINFKNEETATRSVPFELTHTPRTRQSGKRIGPWQTERKKKKKKRGESYTVTNNARVSAPSHF